MGSGVAQGMNEKERSMGEKGARQKHRDGQCHTLEVVMEIILVVSRIDHEIAAYIASTETESPTNMHGEAREKTVLKVHNMSRRKLYNGIRRQLKHKGINTYLAKVGEAREVRNNLAHCIDSITPSGVTGNYEWPVNYSTNSLKNTLRTAKTCTEEMISIFLNEPQYVLWKKIGKERSQTS